MADEPVQGAQTPATAPAQGASTPATAPSQETVPPVRTETTPLPGPTVPPHEWQQMQETLREQNKRISESERKAFEKENPIVVTDKYKDRWNQMMELRGTPGHRYGHLSHEELLRIMRDPVEVPEARPVTQMPTVPSFNPTVSPDLPSGSMSAETREMLRLRYTEDEIKAVERSAG